MTIDITTRRPRRSAVATAVDALTARRVVVLIDDEADSADLLFAAATADTPVTAFTVRHSGGFLEVVLDDAACRRLRLPAAAEDATAERVSVDLRGRGTGISAADRAATIAALADRNRTHDEFTRPGHVVPVRARSGGVISHRGRAEAAVDLVELAGLPRSTGLSALVAPERPWEMANGAEARAFAAEHDLPVVTIADVFAHRLVVEPALSRDATAGLPTAQGPFEVVSYRGIRDGGTYVALCTGDLTGPVPVPVHVHRECLTGDVLRSTACACGTDLADAMTTVKEEGRGLVVYLRPSGAVRACGLLDDPGDDGTTVASAVLADLGVGRARLLAGTEALQAELSAAGIEIVDVTSSALAG